MAIDKMNRAILERLDSIEAKLAELLKAQDEAPTTPGPDKKDAGKQASTEKK